MSKSYLNLIDEVSIKINGKKADTISRPTKDEIGIAVNEAEKMMVLDKPQYNFLRKTAQINVWKPGTGTVTTLIGNPAYTGGVPNSIIDTYFATGVYNTATNFNFAEGYTVGNTQPQTISKVSMNIQTQNNVGNIPLQGTFSASIVGVVSASTTNPAADPNSVIGGPDYNNILATCINPIIVNNDQGTQDGGVTFTNFQHGNFSLTFDFDNTLCLGTGTKVYVVFTFSALASNGRTVVPKDFVATDTVRDSWFWGGSQLPHQVYPNWPYPTPSSTDPSWRFGLTIVANNAVYSYTNVSLPSDCRLPIRAGLPGSNFLFLPVDASQAMFKQFSCPLSSFYISGVDSSGNQTITFNLQYNYNSPQQLNQGMLTLPTTPYLLLDYISSAGVMTSDADIPVVPQDYVEALVYGALVSLFSDNQGLPYNSETYEKRYLYTVDKMNSIVLPQRSVAVQINTGSFTSTMAAVRGSSNGNSLYNAYWPNSWANSFFSAYGNGITSQG